jgi:pimeloyl-ACP methyl ester carboxylesterase
MRTAISKDGTSIAFWTGGEGPPLLLVHGGLADHTTTWPMVLPALEKRFTVLVMDRRGRGASGDAAAYRLAREPEDVAAVVDAIGGQVFVLGHSHGGLCSLEAALLTPNLSRLIVYEGVPLKGADHTPPGAIDWLEEMLAGGDAEGALVAFLRDFVEMPSEEIALMRSQRDAWAIRLGNVPSLLRELRAYEAYVFAPERFRALATPALLVVGGDSPARELTDARGVAAALPHARVAVLPGQQHVAMFTAPELFVREVVGFLEESESPQV